MKNIVYKAKNLVYGNLAGRHLSKFKGNGLNFKELREYIYGEDTKKIDWKISAKLGKPYVKEFDEEREINIIIAILASGSINFGSVKLKSELIAEIVGILGYSAVKYDDKVSLHIFSNKNISFKPTKSIKMVPFLIEQVYKFDYLRKDYNEDFILFLNKFKKSILFIISDFYKHPPIKNLKHETFVLWIRDKLEENPLNLGEIDLINSITFKRIHTNFSKKRVLKYKKELQKQDEKFIEYLQKEKIKFVKIYTEEEPFYKLVELLK